MEAIGGSGCESFDLLQHGEYATITTGNDTTRLDPRIPLSLYEAHRNAMKIAQATGADKYAGPSFQKAQPVLQQAEDSQNHKAPRKSVDMTAREAVQTAADARSITVKRIDEERQDAARKGLATGARNAHQDNRPRTRKRAKHRSCSSPRKKRHAIKRKRIHVPPHSSSNGKLEQAAQVALQQKAAAEAQQQQAEKAAELAAQQKAAAEADAERAKQSVATVGKRKAGYARNF